MLVLMMGQVSGLRNGRPWPPPGHTVELPDDEAARLVQQQMAVPAVDPDTGVEIAVREQSAVEKREALVKTRTVKRS